MKGWLISSSPERPRRRQHALVCVVLGILRALCKDRFGDEWHLSPEQSLLLHAENTVIPTQVVIYSPKGTNNIDQAAVRHVRSMT